MQEGKHFDDGKPRWDLLPLDPVSGVVQVLTFGSGKYGDRNWEQGIKTQKLFASMMRHIFKWMNGIDLDEESGLHHLDHALCNLMMMRWMTLHKPEMVNRPKVEGA